MSLLQNFYRGPVNNVCMFFFLMIHPAIFWRVLVDTLSLFWNYWKFFLIFLEKLNEEVPLVNIIEGIPSVVSKRNSIYSSKVLKIFKYTLLIRTKERQIRKKSLPCPVSNPDGIFARILENSHRDSWCMLYKIPARLQTTWYLSRDSISISLTS